MAFDLSRCPQTEDEARAWYFAGIGRSEGGPANDYAAVMGASGLPPGYGPGVIPSAAMPFFAFTNMVGSSGDVRGRIFLPTNQPDENNYYTRQIQVIKDGPTPGSLVWSWTYISGHAYAPVQGADGGVTPTPPGGLNYEEIGRTWAALVGVAGLPQTAALAEQIKGLEARVKALEDAGGQQPTPLPTKIALKDSRGKYLCADRDQAFGADHQNVPILANRDGRGEWETFALEPVE